MMIRVAPDRLRVDPKRPKSHPNYEFARQVGERNLDAHLATMENDAQRRDYIKKVRSNPNNVPGLPATYPPELIRIFNTFPDCPELPFGEKVRRMVRDVGIKYGMVFCHTCHSMTSHSISPEESFCQKCGNHKPFTNNVAFL